MRPALACLIAVGLSLLAGVGHSRPKKPEPPLVAPTGPRKPADERKAFRLPEGFEAQLVACEPDIHKPLNIAFDARGRLWVTETVEYPFPAASGRRPRDGVKVLEDFSPEGRARKVTTFADGLNIPIGILPLPGARPQEALVHSIPSILRLRDTRGEGKADHSEALLQRFDFHDTHGMTNNFTWGFDGWVYACHGFANTSRVKSRGGSSVTMNSGNTYRFRPDGSRVQQFTWGQVNPFGLTFDPLGNLYSADCHSQPIYQLLRGAYYPSFGKPDDGLGFGPEMFTDYDGSTAIAGIAYYAADAFPKEYRGNCFIGDVVTNEIVLFRITWHGSTPKATQHTFLKSDDPWFRPVNILLGPDGALYVADFYNRIIGHYEVPLTHPGRDRTRGRIWRIVYKGKGAKGTPAPRRDWTRASAAELVGDLRHPNLTVRMKAANQLVTRGGKEGVKGVREALDFGKRDEASGWQRAHGLWVLERCGELDDETLGKGIKDADHLVRVHAHRILSERPRLTPKQHGWALAGLADDNPHVRRAAADALGQHPSAENLRPLLALRHKVPAKDTHLLHVVRMALRNQLRPSSTWEKVNAHKWDERDARALADVALGVHSAEAAGFLLGHVRHYAEPDDALTRMVHHVARYGGPDTTRGLFDFLRTRVRGPRRQAALLRAFERGHQERGLPLDERVREWAVGLTARLLDSKQADEVRAGIELTGVLKVEAQQKKVSALAADRKAPEGVRLAALNALAALDARRHAPTLGRVLADAGTPIQVREHAANLLANANQAPTRAELVAALPSAPARLQNVIASGLAGSRAGARKLLDAVAEGKASARLLRERGVALRLEATGLPGLKERLDKLTAGLPEADAKVQELIAQRRKGFRAAKVDPSAGAKVFEKHCAICHQVGGKGARIGPQLDGIGLRGLDRLLEDVLDPSRNVDQAFRLTTLNLKKGSVVSGLLLREEGALYVLADEKGKEVPVKKSSVEERTTSQMSPMPANFADQVGEKDFYDLMAYLLSLKAGKPEKR
jgi:putative heme-binding domain-containing protein